MTHLALCAIFLIGQWHEENMEINYVQENPKALLRHEHSARMRLLLEETLGRLSGTCLKRSGSEIYIVKKKTKELSWSTSRVSVWYFLPRLAWAFHLLGQDSCNVQRGKRCCC